MSPRDNWPAVAALSSAIHFGGSGLSDVPVLIERVIKDGSWKIFQNELSADPFINETFEEFVTAKPMKGLGASKKLVERLVQGTPAAKLVRDAFMSPPNPDGLNQYSEERGSTNNRSRTTKQGTSRDYTLDRLQRNAPELFDAVQRNELSPNAAAIKAGFRPKTFTVRADKPESIAATLRRQLSPEVLALVAKMLSEDR
jgi:hypothetical protein